MSAALRLDSEVQNAIIVCIICDRGDRYLSTGVFGSQAMESDPQPCEIQEYGSAISRLESYPEPRFVLFTGIHWDCT